jgi:hypothetical protein
VGDLGEVKGEENMLVGELLWGEVVPADWSRVLHVLLPGCAANIEDM